MVRHSGPKGSCVSRPSMRSPVAGISIVTGPYFKVLLSRGQWAVGPSTGERAARLSGSNAQGAEGQGQVLSLKVRLCCLNPPAGITDQREQVIGGARP